MSIVLYTGIPGSGKTYRVVSELAKPEIQNKYMIFHNIEGLKLSGEYIKDWRTIDGFLSKAKQEEITSYAKEKTGRPCLVIIDEAQLLFDKRNADLKAWLSWHRHLGQDIWLICQHFMMIDKDYNNLIEFECRAKKGVVVPFFLYHYMVQGEVFRKERIGKKDHVFNLYQSFEMGSVKKKGSKIVHYAVGGFVVAIVLAVAFFGWGVKSVFGKSAPLTAPALSRHEKRIEKPELKKPVLLEKDKDPSSWACCLVIGSKVALCDDEGRVADVEDALPGFRLVGIEKGYILVSDASQNLTKIKIKAKRAKAVPTAQASAGGRDSQFTAIPKGLN